MNKAWGRIAQFIKILAIASVLILTGLGNAQVQILGCEIIQSVQSLNSDVPLISSKSTLIRVYAISTSSGKSVRGELTITNQAGSPQLLKAGLTAIGSAASAAVLRDDISKSLNFILPNTLTTGSITLATLQLYDSQGTMVQCSGCGLNRQVQFVTAPTLVVREVGFSYQVPGSTAIATPRDVDFDSIDSWLKRAYPVAALSTTRTTLEAADQGLTASDLQNCNSVNAVLAGIRTSEVASGRNYRTHYYGVVPDDGGFMFGCSAGVPDEPDPTVVASGPSGVPGSSFAAWDKEPSYAGWYAGHELAHTFGRYHPGFCANNSKDDTNFPSGWDSHISGANADQYVGLDFGSSTPSILPGTQWNDIMTYCDYVWPSSYTYAGILKRLEAEAATTYASAVYPAAATIALNRANPLPGSSSNKSPFSGSSTAQIAQAPAPPQEMGLNVIATVNLTKKSGTIKFVSRVERSPAPSKDLKSRGAIRALDDRGDTIFTLTIPIRPDTDIRVGKDETALVNSVVPDSPRISKLQLLLDNEQIAQISVEPKEKEAKLTGITTHVLNKVEAESPDYVGFIPAGADEQTKEGLLVRWNDTSESSSYTIQIGPADESLETLAVSVNHHYYVIKKMVLDRYHGRKVRVVVSANNLSRSQVLSTTLDVK